MTPAETAALAAKLDALHEDVREVRDLAASTNGRVRTLELWRAKTEGALSIASLGGRPILTFLVAVASAVVTYLLTH